MFYYAQLNEGNLCVGVSALSGTLSQKDMVALESYDISLLGKRYANGLWEEVSKEPKEPELILSSEELQAEILLNQQQIITRQNTQEAVLSQLLLNQQGGSVNV